MCSRESQKNTSQKVIRPRIEIGYRVGMLSVVEKTDGRKAGYTVWRCRCDCGDEILLDTRCLQRGTIVDCGCTTATKPGSVNLTGQRFGRLTAIEQTSQRDGSGNVIWECRCDCGNSCRVSVRQLRAGYTKSCGCLGHPPLKRYIGRRFGKLTVTDYAGKKNGMHQWKCICDCGNVTTVGQTRLQKGITKSCGCLQKSIILDNAGTVGGSSVKLIEHYKTHLNPNNTSGHNGVYFDKSSGRWVAIISFKNKNYYLGSYEKIEDAIAARKRGEEMHDQFLKWYYEEYLKKRKMIEE